MLCNVGDFNDYARYVAIILKGKQWTIKQCLPLSFRTMDNGDLTPRDMNS